MKSFAVVAAVVSTVFAVMIQEPQMQGSQVQTGFSTPSNPADTKQANDRKSSPLEAREPLVPPIPSITSDATSFLTAATPGLEFDFSHDSSAAFHGHGDLVCASGCSLSRHPTEKLTLRKFRDLLQQCSAEPMDAENLAFETLLFFGRQTSKLIDRHGVDQLTNSQAAILKRELQRQHARVSIRVVDQHGVKRSWTDSVRVPLDRRHVFTMKTDGVQPLVTSGTVKRVGLDHLWTRL